MVYVSPIKSEDNEEAVWNTTWHNDKLCHKSDVSQTVPATLLIEYLLWSWGSPSSSVSAERMKFWDL